MQLFNGDRRIVHCIATHVKQNWNDQSHQREAIYSRRTWVWSLCSFITHLLTHWLTHWLKPSLWVSGCWKLVGFANIVDEESIALYRVRRPLGVLKHRKSTKADVHFSRILNPIKNSTICTGMSHILHRKKWFRRQNLPTFWKFSQKGIRRARRGTKLCMVI